MPRQPQPLRIAIDTGGTFTDCVWIDTTTRRLRMLKVFSTPADPSQAIVEALKQIAPAKNLILLHGTTVGTNTLLERKGARTALVTTAGSKTRSRSDARPVPNFTISSSTASPRSSLESCASASTNALPRTAKS